MKFDVLLLSHGPERALEVLCHFVDSHVARVGPHPQISGAEGLIVEAQRMHAHQHFEVGSAKRNAGGFGGQPVHVFAGGKIVRSGGAELADELERDGYVKYSGAPESAAASVAV